MADSAVTLEGGLLPERKRLKPTPEDDAAVLRAVIAANLLSSSSRASLRQQYQESAPYPHCVIPELCVPELLMTVRDEIVENIQATYKETDLFKVFQTGDLGNLDKLDAAAAAKLPSLMALKAALYSAEFRAFVREVTGCGELADKTDCSCNVYPQGGHLLCHDDVIGTRRVSYIIYMTDPEGWREEDGGSLELYPEQQGQPHQPAVHPSVALLPLFNTMAMFTVLPGRSFHSVQEVFAADKPRMSISGWYHAPCEPPDAQQASLQQLQAKPRPGAAPQAGAPPPPSDPALTAAGGGAGGAQRSQDEAEGGRAGQDNASVEGFLPFSAGPEQAYGLTSSGAAWQPGPPARPAAAAGVRTAVPPSEEDLTLLATFVNASYLSPAAWPKVAAKFAESGSLQLQNFLTQGWAERIAAAVKAEDEAAGLGRGRRPSYQAGLSGGWQAVGPPHKQRYCTFTPPPINQPSPTPEAAAKEGAPEPEQETMSGAGAARGAAATALSPAGLLMSQVQQELFGSAAFARLLHALTTLTLLGQRGEVRRFRPGLDYTVAHFGIVTKDPRLDAVLCFVAPAAAPPDATPPAATPDAAAAASTSTSPALGNKASRAAAAAAPTPWDDGEVGGFEAYLLADEDKTGAAAEEVYRQDQDESGVLNVSAAHNSLNLVLRDEGLMKFVKYVSAAAPGSRWDVAMEYLPEDDSDDEEDADGSRG